jgi:epoxyqueuosine reductase QueG
MKKDYDKKLRKFCREEGIDLCAVADINPLKKEILIQDSILKKLDRAICLGVGLSRTILEEIENQPTKLYFHHYRMVNVFLDQAALRLARLIQNDGFLALPIPASQIVDWQRQTAHLSHKKMGLLAGLGWIGRNNLLVNERFGSQFRLVTVLTNTPLVANKPLKKDCGDCFACVSVCPVSAIKINPEDFEHQKCFTALKDFQKQHVVEQYICGICVKACQMKPRLTEQKRRKSDG